MRISSGRRQIKEGNIIKHKCVSYLLLHKKRLKMQWLKATCISYSFPRVRNLGVA